MLANGEGLLEVVVLNIVERVQQGGMAPSLKQHHY
jgi:hypothetical protein